MLADHTRVALDGITTIGRAPGSTVVLADPAVSRHHARITVARGAVTVEDAGSSHGTWVDGRRITRPVPARDGARIRVGDQTLVVERRRRDDEAGRTVVVGAGAPGTADPGGRPRLRAGSVLKRLEASEGPQRWVLRGAADGGLVRLADAEGDLLELLDGRLAVVELLDEAELRLGPDGPSRMVRLLAELADRGFLDDPGAAPPANVRPGLLRRLLAPREWVWRGAGPWFARLYARGGRRLFEPAGLATMALVAVAGLAAFAYLVAGRYGTPFVVANKLGLGGLVFVAGRLSLAAVHECAHGLALASYGRRAGRAGLKLVLIFPYAFVDTSESWLEPRRHRIAISLAGPVADAVLGAVFALACLLLAPGALRDICFQLAFGAYLAGLMNLNPFVERDGYHVLGDVLREPRLRRKARAELAQRLRTGAGGTPSPMLLRYAVIGLVWSVVAAGLAIVVSLRYEPALRALLPAPVVSAMLVCVWAAALAPVALAVGAPLRDRARRPREAA